MFRRLVLVSVLAVAVAGCGSESPSPTAGTDLVWLTAPGNAEQRREVMQRARGIDVCALLPRDELGEVGEVISVKTTGPGACDAVLDAADPSDGTSVKWRVLMDPPAPEGAALPGTVGALGDVSVRTITDGDAPAATRPNSGNALAPCSPPIRRQRSCIWRWSPGRRPIRAPSGRNCCRSGWRGGPSSPTPGHRPIRW